MSKERVCVLKTGGINCDEEMMHAFELAGDIPKLVHLNEFKDGSEIMDNFHTVGLPGGFANSDDLGAGKVFAIDLMSYLADQLENFTDKKKGLVVGVCNGFQVLVRAGLLPFGTLGEMQVTLTDNNSGHFDCRWVNLKVDDHHKCEFLRDLSGEQITLPVAHGEGKFEAPENVINRIEGKGQVVFRYADLAGEPTMKYSANPNGSVNAIAGICDPTGRILGLMPHPERFVRRTQHENWHRYSADMKPDGLQIFKKMVNYARQMR